MKSQKINGIEHIVFDSRDEFERHFLHKDGKVPVLREDWRNGREYDWVLADDGGIVQILKQAPLPHTQDRKNYKNHPNGYCRTVVGTFIQDKSVRMDTDFELHPDRYRFGSSTNAEVSDRRRNRENLSSPEVIFVAAICSGKSLQSAYEEAYGPHVDWRNRALFLLKRERIMKEINKNVDEVARELGLDYKWIMERLMKLANEADNGTVILGALRELAEWIGGKEKLKQITSGQMTVFQPFDESKLIEIEAEKTETIANVDMEKS